MKRPPLRVIGGLIGILYFIVTVLFAAFGSVDSEQASVIAQVTNLHVTFIFALLSKILPLGFVSNVVIQLIVGLAVNYATGWLIGSGIARIFGKDKEVESTQVVGVPM